MKQLLLHSTTLCVEYYPLYKYLYIKWTGRQFAATIREGYEQIPEILRQTSCHRLLDDHRLAQGYWAEATDWFVSNWRNRAQQAGLQMHSMVYADDFFGRHSIDLVLDRLSPPLITSFETVEEAHAFLLSKELRF